MTDRHLLFLFLDGVGLGAGDPQVNPLAAVDMPVLTSLLGGRRLLRQSAPLENERATLLALDTGLGVPGLPQSATGQAVLLTGQNVPARLGYHYGPKPNPEVAEIIRNGTLFEWLKAAGKCVDFLDAYPPRYFDGIESGRRLYSAFPLAAVSAGISLKTGQDLIDGRGVSADFTGQGWREYLKLPHTPLLNPWEAGRRLAELAQACDFSLFEYWLSDYAGHHQNMNEARSMLETLDGVLGGLLEAWDHTDGLLLITSDHGNMEDLGTRRHTANPVPGLLIGDLASRREFSRNLHDLTGIAPAIQEYLGALGYN
jgi:hypothetical protein